MTTKKIGREFMELTRYAYLETSEQKQGLPQPPLQAEYDSSQQLIDLPSPETFPAMNVNLLEFIEMRTSVRKYAQRPLTVDELSYLLWCTQGVKMVMSDAATFRTVPSAGARHAFETYLLINNVEGIVPGLYRFLALEHKLLAVKLDAAVADEIVTACLEQKFIKTSAVTFLWVAAAARMKWRYGERGYRYLHLDAGHVCQNLYLAGEAIGCGTCAIAAFEDEQINNALGIDGVDQFLIYLAAVGKKL